MTCFIAKNMLSEYVDEALDPARLRELEEHLATCASCARELAEIRRIRQSLRVLPVEKAPADFYAKVMAKAERKTVLERVSGALSVVWKLPAPAKAGVAFAASVVVVATVWVNNEHRDLWSLGAAPGRQLEQTAARAPAVADAEVPPPPPSGGADSADALAANEDERPKAAPADDGHEYKDGKLVATGAFAAATATPAARANPAREAQGGIGVAPSLDADAGTLAGAKQNRRAGATGTTTTTTAALAEKKATPPATTTMPKNEVANGDTSTLRKAAAAPEKVARMRDASATDLPTSAVAATPPTKPSLYASQPAGAGRGAGDGFVAGGDLGGAGNGGGGAGAAGGSGSTAMHAHATSSGPAAAETREHAPLQPRTTVAAKSARAAAPAPARSDAAKPDGANAAAPAPASAPQMEFSGGEASPEPAFGSGAALDDAASSDTGEAETTRDQAKSASGKGKRAEAAREAPSESEESLSTESLARASKEQDKDVQEEATKAPNGSASAPFPARFTTSLANGPALVVDAVRAIGGRAITTNPPALAKSGVSTVVLVEIPPSKWDAFAEKLHDAGDLSLQSDPPTARARIRIEVIRH